MSRDKMHCSSVILSVVAECSVKVFDDVGVFVTDFSLVCLGPSVNQVS